jgi:hypothetical protein
MSRAPTVTHWVLAGLMMSFAGVVFDAVRATPPRSLRDALGQYHASTIHNARLPSPVGAAVLLQLRDCSSNLRMLHVLHRGASRDRIRLAVIWYAGPVGDSLAIRAELPPWTAEIPLRPVSGAVLKQFALLGHTTTPALLVADQEGRVRFATQSPRSSREVAGLRQIVEGLTFLEEL